MQGTNTVVICLPDQNSGKDHNQLVFDYNYWPLFAVSVCVALQTRQQYRRQ